MLSARLFNLLAGLLLFSIGIYGIFDPSGFATYLQFDLIDNSAIIEFMAAHGSLYLMLGMIFCFCSTSTKYLYHGLKLLVLLCIGFGIGRAYGMILYGAVGEHVLWLVLEIVGTIVGLVILKFSPEQ